MMKRTPTSETDVMAALRYFEPANMAALHQLRSTMDRSYPEVNCGHRVFRKPTLDEQDGNLED